MSADRCERTDNGLCCHALNMRPTHNSIQDCSVYWNDVYLSNKKCILGLIYYIPPPGLIIPHPGNRCKKTDIRLSCPALNMRPPHNFHLGCLIYSNDVFFSDKNIFLQEYSTFRLRGLITPRPGSDARKPISAYFFTWWMCDHRIIPFLPASYTRTTWLERKRIYSCTKLVHPASVDSSHVWGPSRECL